MQTSISSLHKRRGTNFSANTKSINNHGNNPEPDKREITHSSDLPTFVNQGCYKTSEWYYVNARPSVIEKAGQFKSPVAL